MDSMNLDGSLEWLTRRKTESDPSFREELTAHSHRGLYVIGFISLAITTVTTITKLLNLDYPHTGEKAWWPTGLFFFLSFASLICARIKPLIRFARPIAVSVALLTLLTVITVDLVATRGAIGDRLMLNIVLVLLVGIATVPLAPLGAILFNVFAVLAWMAGWRLADAAGFPLGETQSPIALGVTAGVCAVLYIVNYDRLLAAHKAFRAALAASEDLRHSQLRTCQSESASTNLRLAAALSHELNTPMGALRSSVDTILTAAGRMPIAAPEKQEKLAVAMRESSLVIAEAVGRLETVVRRMQRFSNLDRAEVQKIDLASMLTDIVDLHAPAAGTTRIEKLFDAVPSLTGQPQALSGIFSSLLKRALDSAGPDGNVRIQITAETSWVRIILDHGQAPVQVDFSLGFAVESDRVSASNWDLFSAREVIRAHGGDIEADGPSGIRVNLPVKQTPVSVPMAEAAVAS